MVETPAFARLRHRLQVTLVVCLVLGAARVVPPAAAQERFAEEVSVVSIEVPVRVLRKGVPVTGLTADDFLVLDRGEAQALTGFEVIDLRLPTDTVPSKAAVAAPAVSPGVPKPVSAPRVGRTFVVLVDFAFSGQRALLRAIPGLRAMLGEQLHPRDRAAVAMWAGDVIMLSGFSDRPEMHALAVDLIEARVARDDKRFRSLAASLAELEAASTPGGNEGAVRALMRRFGPTAGLALGPIRLSPGSVAAGTVLDPGAALVANPRDAQPDQNLGGGAEQVLIGDPADIARAFEQEASYHGVTGLAQRLAAFVTLLRDVPGDKHLLYFSEGFSEMLFMNPVVVRAFERMFEACRRSGWTIQAVDISGIPTASDGVDEAFGGPVSMPVNSGLRGFNAGAMYLMTEETGGQLFEHENTIARATARLIERTSVTYLLSFERSDLPADGAYRKIKVRLRDGLPEARLVYRPGYHAPKPLEDRSEIEQRVADAERLLGREERRDLDAAVLAVAPPGGDGTVPVVVQVAGDDLLAGFGAQAETLELAMHLYALDAAGDVADLVIETMRFGLAEVRSKLEAGGLRHVAQLTLEPGKYRLRTLIRRRDDERHFLASSALTVPMPGGFAWMPPLWLDATDSWLLTRNQDVEGEPFTLGGRAFVPVPEPRVAAGGPLAFVLAVPGGTEARFEGEVLDVEGGAQGGRLTIDGRVEAGDGVDHLIGRLATAGLPTGRYRLVLRARAPAGDAIARVEGRFRVQGP